MFNKAKNIDSAFRQARMLSLVTILTSTLVTCFTLYQSFRQDRQRSQQVLILPTGKVIEAVSTDRKDNLEAEMHDHVRTFHECFFGLEPDDKAIQTNINRALYLADNSAKQAYDNLRENGYYSNIISGNVNQQITIDSVRTDTRHYPYFFQCYASLAIVRPTSIAKRSLVTKGYLRNIKRSENNSHGFLIERWETLENRDISVKPR